MTIANWQLSCDMLLMIAVLSSMMPKTDICQVILRGIMPCFQISVCSFTKLVWHIDYRKKLFAGF